MQIRFMDIKWDTDGHSPKDLGLPEEVILPVGDEVDLDTEGADVLSDEYGWCVFSFDWEMIE